MKRRFVDAKTEDRCQADATMRDGNLVQCGRRKTIGNFCTQHGRLVAASMPTDEVLFAIYNDCWLQGTHDSDFDWKQFGRRCFALGKTPNVI